MPRFQCTQGHSSHSRDLGSGLFVHNITASPVVRMNTMMGDRIEAHIFRGKFRMVF